MKSEKKKKGLSDKELIAKYDTGKLVDFEAAIKKIIKTSNPEAKPKRP